MLKKNSFFLFLYFLGFCAHCNTLHASGNKYIDVTNLKKKLSSREREIYKSALLTLIVGLEQSSSHVIPYYGSLCPALESLYFKIFEKNKNLKNETLSSDMSEILDFIYTFRSNKICISDGFLKKLISIDHSSYYFLSRKVMKILVYRKPTSKESFNYTKKHMILYLKGKEYNDTSNLLFDLKIFIQLRQRELSLERASKKKALFFLKQKDHLEEALKIFGVLYRHAPDSEIENLLFTYLKQPFERSYTAIQVIARDVFPYTNKAKQQSFVKHVRDVILKIFMNFKISKTSYPERRKFAKLAAISMNMGVEFEKSCKVLSYFLQGGSFMGPDSYVDAMWFLKTNTYIRIMASKSCYHRFQKIMIHFLGCWWDGKSCEELPFTDHPLTYQSSILGIFKKNPSFAIPLLPVLRSLLEKKMLEHPVDLGCTVLKKIIQKIERQKLKTRKPKQRR